MGFSFDWSLLLYRTSLHRERQGCVAFQLQQFCTKTNNKSIGDALKIYLPDNYVDFREPHMP